MTDTATDALDRAHLQLRFFHLQKFAMAVRGGVTESDLHRVAERLAGVGSDRRAAIEAEFAAQVSGAASQLVEDPAVQQALARIPFQRGDRIVALGDSITDDALSWAEQLAAVLTIGRPDLGLAVINAGFTGDTTQNVIARFDTITAHRPHWVIQLLGTNDIRRHGRRAVRMSTSEETRRNLDRIRDLVEHEAGARLVVLTPPPVDEEQVRSWPPFAEESITWKAADAEELAALVREESDEMIDLHTAMRAAGVRGLLLPDGLHPSLAGQRFITKTVLTGLATIAP